MHVTEDVSYTLRVSIQQNTYLSTSVEILPATAAAAATATAVVLRSSCTYAYLFLNYFSLLFA